MESIRKYVVKQILHHRAKTYIIVGVLALLIGFLSGYLAGKRRMKRKMRRQRIAEGIKNLKDSHEKPGEDGEDQG